MKEKELKQELDLLIYQVEKLEQGIKRELEEKIEHIKRIRHKILYG